MPHDTLGSIMLSHKNPLDVKELQITLEDLDKCFHFENLEVLDIIDFGNSASPLPKEVLNFKKLHTIKLNDFFSIFPDFLAEMPQLKNLTLPAYYSLQYPLDFPDIFHTFEHLESLKIGLYFDTNRPDVKFPTSISKMKKLKRLHLQINQMEDLSKDTFLGLESLEELNITYGSISNEIQENIFLLKNLKNLSLNGSFTYTNRELNSRLRFENGFSEKIINLKKLEKLSISKGKLTKIPHFLKELTSLQELDLTDNNIQKFPFLLSEMPNLTKLDISGNKNLLLETILQGGDNLREIDITSCNLKNIPANIQNCQKLEILNVSTNKLAILPSEILKIPTLTTLKIDRNTLSNTTELKTSTINALILSFRQRNLAENLQILEFSLIQNHTKILKSAKKKDLLTCLYAPNPSVRLNALIALEKHIKMPFSLDLDPKTTLISVLGKIAGANMVDITKFFKEKGYKIINKIDPKTTHICISEQSKTSLADVNKAVFEQNIKLSLPKHLKDFQQLLEKPYLLDTKTDALATAVADMTQNVGDLLKSNNADNQQLALQIMETGGVPDDLMYVLALMIIENQYYFGTNFEGKSRKIRKLLQKYAPTSLQAVVAKYYKKTAYDILKFVLEEESIDQKQLLKAGLQYDKVENTSYYPQINYNVFFKWGIKKGGEYLKIIYKNCLEGNVLNFSKHLIHTKQLFREELLAFPEIEVIEVSKLDGVTLGYATNIPTIKEIIVSVISKTTIQRIQKVYPQLKITIKGDKNPI